MPFYFDDPERTESPVLPQRTVKFVRADLPAIISPVDKEPTAQPKSVDKPGYRKPPVFKSEI